ncbi:unnamed protein product [Bursaphelenchus xylophilus]|uniref:Major sperm protein n=1 Tax=Bursaphelenchus xylophilus TaxID=6326 RepID=A0A1I7S1C3_BURXY|nr:unnamed protein product [Bursaphelenchus xylophilus]CAG9080266.1 unnamed protein product [Bursaphelenchus xylophilus]
MSKPQFVALEPNNELRFNGPFTEVVTSHLKLQNLTDKPVNFKVKTTAPRFYCVRPNCGQIAASGTVTVNVMLQPVDQVQTLEKERSRHKFLVQSALATDEPVEAFWKSVDPTKIADARLKVVFANLDAGSDTSTARLDDNHSTAQYTSTDKVFEEKINKSSENPLNAQPRPNLVHRAPASHGDEGKSSEKDAENRRLTAQNQELRQKLSEMLMNRSEPSQNIFNLQVLLVSLAALLIGIILGKLF